MFAPLRFLSLPRRVLPGLVLLLAACGGDHDHRPVDSTPPDNDARAIAVDAQNAESLLGEAMFVANLMTLNVAYDLNMYSVVMPVTACDNDGTVARETEPDGAGRVTAIDYENCRISLGPDTDLMLDGDLAFQYDSADPASPFQVDATTFVSDLRENQGGTVYGNRTRLDGTLRMTPDPIAGLPFASVSDAGLTLAFEYLEDNQSLHAREWQLQDFAVPFAVDLMTGGMGIGARGRLSLTGPDQPAGFIDVDTDPLLSTSMAACPDSGDLTVTGAEDSQVRLSVQHADEAVITTNGNARLIDCGELLDLADPMAALVIAH